MSAPETVTHVLAVTVPETRQRQRQYATVRTDAVAKRISRGIYGHFFEHIFHSSHGGLWGDQVLNGAMELCPSAGAWVQSADGVLSLQAPKPAPAAILNRLRHAFPLWLGAKTWTDYEVVVQARKLRDLTPAGGHIALIFRAETDRRCYILSLGDSGNTEHRIHRVADSELSPFEPRVVAGSVSDGGWHEIRLRCEGQRIQVSLDGRTIFDFRDEDVSAYAKGGIALDARDAAVEFKALSVKTLAGGETLVASPLPVSALRSAPRHWSLFGEAPATHFSNCAIEPVGGDLCFRVERDAGAYAAAEAGIRQGNLSLVRGETYTLGLFVRGEPGSAGFVSIADGDGLIFRQALPALGSAWAKVEFRFASPRTTAVAVLAVGLDLAAATASPRAAARLDIDAVSLFSASALANGGFRPDLYQALADLKPASLRWPGGSFIYFYRWRDAIGPRERRRTYPTEQWADRDTLQIGTDEFMDLCERLETEPILVLNTAFSVEDNLEWIEYCIGDETTPGGRLRASHGRRAPYKLTYVEIDNESWLIMRKPAYVATVRRFAAAIRAKYPHLKIIACGSYGFDTGKGQGGPDNAGWDQDLLDGAAPLFDVISTHYYHGLFGEPLEYATDPRNYERFLLRLHERIRKSANPKIEIYVSEWNLTSPRCVNDWRVGLYAAGILNAFERQGDVVTMTCPALLFRREGITTAWDNSMVNFDQSRWFPGANYVVMKLWSDAFAPQVLDLDTQEQPLSVVVTKSDDGDTIFIKVANCENVPCELVLTLEGGFTPAAARYDVIFPGTEAPRNSLDKPDALKPAPAAVVTEGQVVKFNVPRYSAGVVRLSRRA